MFCEWRRIRQPIHTFRPPNSQLCIVFNRNINSDVSCRSVNLRMVTPWHKSFRQIRTHLTTYLRLEYKLKDESIALHSPFFDVPRHTNGFIRRRTKLTFSVLFTTDTVEAAHALEDPHNICLSETLAPIMKFPTREHLKKKLCLFIFIIFPTMLLNLITGIKHGTDAFILSKCLQRFNKAFGFQLSEDNVDA